MKGPRFEPCPIHSGILFSTENGDGALKRRSTRILIGLAHLEVRTKYRKHVLDQVGAIENLLRDAVQLHKFSQKFGVRRSEEHTSELQSHVNLVCRLLLEKK